MRTEGATGEGMLPADVQDRAIRQLGEMPTDVDDMMQWCARYALIRAMGRNSEKAVPAAVVALKSFKSKGNATPGIAALAKKATKKT